MTERRVAAAVALLAFAGIDTVAAHGATHPGHVPWTALGLFVLGTATLGGSLYADRATDLPRTRVDLGVAAGVLALAASVVLFW